MLFESINQVQNVELKKHMLSALSSFQTAETQSSSSRDTMRTDGAKDHILQFLSDNPAEIKCPKDALVVAIHLLIVEGGFQPKFASDSSKLPEGWNTHSASNLFQLSYRRRDNEDSCYTLKIISIGDKFELYFSDSTERVHSLEVSMSDYIDETSPKAPLHSIGTLRARIKGFLENIEASNQQPKISEGFHPTQRTERDEYEFENRGTRYPSVGSGDVFMPSRSGGDPGMLVGPNHEIFRRRQDPARGIVPGARFDPFGPVMGPNIPSRDGNMPFPAAPRLPFGDPNPDHLRMPRDDDNDDFGFSSQPRRDFSRSSGSSFPYF
ncbi:unnamed protein product [Albugo candida]|nr:unnamed protein product [Albugo candida]|eukprot:CCI48178.1 unnamed protein product [Albugo candida]